MEDGINSVYNFFNDWFINKCLWSSENSIKETASSIKKFYECMSEKKHINNEDYKMLCKIIKEHMTEFINSYIEIYDYEEDEWEEFI